MICTYKVTEWGSTNCYFLGNSQRHGFLIDPGAEGERLVRDLAAARLTVEKILITHGHYDHIGAVPIVARALGVPVLMRDEGRRYAENSYWNLSALADRELRLQNVTYFRGGDAIALGSDPAFTVETISAPGHTSDGTVYWSKQENAAFVGDTIFLGSRGRTDLPGGDERTIIESIRRILSALPDSTRLYSGHSAPTRVADEKPWYGL